MHHILLLLLLLHAAASHPAPCCCSLPLRPQLLTPVVEGILSADMKRFAEYAVQHRQNIGA